MTEHATRQGGAIQKTGGLVSADQTTIIGDGTAENPLRVAAGSGDVTAADIDSASAGNGEVLTADGAGGAAWQTPGPSAAQPLQLPPHLGLLTGAIGPADPGAPGVTVAPDERLWLGVPWTVGATLTSMAVNLFGGGAPRTLTVGLFHIQANGTSVTLISEVVVNPPGTWVPHAFDLEEPIALGLGEMFVISYAAVTVGTRVGVTSLA